MISVTREDPPRKIAKRFEWKSNASLWQKKKMKSPATLKKLKLLSPFSSVKFFKFRNLPYPMLFVRLKMTRVLIHLITTLDADIRY